MSAITKALPEVKFIHLRNYEEDMATPCPQGGLTVAFVPSNDNEVWVGLAKCSERDNFCKHTGRAIAKGRLENGKYHVVKTNQTSIKETVNNLTNWALKEVYGS